MYIDFKNTSGKRGFAAKLRGWKGQPTLTEVAAAAAAAEEGGFPCGETCISSSAFACVRTVRFGTDNARFVVVQFVVVEFVCSSAHVTARAPDVLPAARICSARQYVVGRG